MWVQRCYIGAELCTLEIWLLIFFPDTEHAPICQKKYSEHTEDSNWTKQLMVKDNCSLFEIWKVCCKLYGEVQRTKHAELDSLKMSKLKANYDNLLSHLNFEKSVNAKIMKRSGNCCFKVEGFFVKKVCFGFVRFLFWLPGESVIFAAKGY